MPWDSKVLGLNVGRVIGKLPLSQEELDSYDMILARIPIRNAENIEYYQRSGFYFIALDLSMSATQPNMNANLENNKYSIFWHSQSAPNFLIEGFNVDDSRLMLDKHCCYRLEKNFWDTVIIEHCTDYADMVVCVVDKQSNRLVGCISCFLNKSELELFLIAVHPDFRNQGIGGAMLEYVSTKAIEHGWSLSTQVLASNVIAMNLYTKYGFKVDGGEAVLHRWKEKVN